MPVARVALPVAAPTLFDYWIPDGLPIGRGAVVRVNLARRVLIGVVVEVLDRSEISREQLQPIADALRELPALPVDLLDLASFVASYYQEPLGLVVAQMIPPLGAASGRVASGRDPAVPLRFTISGRTSLAASL